VDESTIEQHFGLVWKLAGKYSRYIRDPAITHDDLVSEGYYGLLMAVRRYDASKGCAFSSYAYQMISGTIQTFLDRKGHRIRFPQHIMYVVNQIIKEGLQDEEAATIAERLQCRVGYVRTALDHIALNTMISLNQPLPEDRDNDYHQLAKDIQDLSVVEVRDFIDRLPERKSTILRKISEGYNGRQIGAMLGITHQAVWQQLNTIRNLYLQYEEEITRDQNSAAG
jgi:RNA polymerase sigma factor (sigma-70 family)